MLIDNERLDDLEYNNLKIIQNPNGYCFTSDSILLTNLSIVKKGDTVVDLGTGSGVISLLVAEKFKPSKVFGVEIQPRLADMASRSVKYNFLEETITIINKPMQGIYKELGSNFDVVISNPPYDKVTESTNNSEIDQCKAEINVTTQEVIVCAGKLLKFGGMFYMINKARRLTDVLCTMRENKIEPKTIYFIQPKESKDVDTFVVAGKKGGKPSMIIPKPIVVYNEDGTFTDFSRRIYNK
jgi:tRNA1Val (adenine37-N6)-methyltransferase